MKKYFDDENQKSRYYIFDYLIGQKILVLDTEKNRYRIDSFNIYGQCYSLKEDWKRITKATVNRALRRTGYVFDSYIREYFTNDKKYTGDNESSLLYKTDDYDDCILFLVKYGKENEDFINNTNFNYYQTYLKNKSRKLEDFEGTIIRRNIEYNNGNIIQAPIYKELEETGEKYFTIKIKNDYENEIELALGFSDDDNYKKYRVGNSIGVRTERLDNGLNKVISVDWVYELEQNAKIDRSTIKADRDFIKNLIDMGALDDVNELKTKGEYESAIDYWVEHYFDDYKDSEIKEEIIDGSSRIASIEQKSEEELI